MYTMLLSSKEEGDHRINIKSTHVHKKMHWRDKSKANTMVTYVGEQGERDRYGIKISRGLSYYKVLTSKPCKYFTFSQKKKLI